MKQKLLTLVLSLFAVVSAWAHDFEVDGIYYYITSETALTVSVSYEGSYSSDVSNEYSGAVVIPESVTYNNKSYSVTEIDYGAFYYCSGLTSVEIPSSVTEIGYYAFYGCSSLTSVVIPSSVKEIGLSAFSGCDNLKYNEYDNGLYLGNSENPYLYLVEAKSNEITSVKINDKTSIIAYYAFYGSDVTRVDYTGTLEGWCNKQWDPMDISSSYDLYINGKKVEEVKIPSSVTEIGESAFSGCSGLTSVSIPSNVVKIDTAAFYGCSGLTSVEISEGVTDIGGGAFYNCTSLTSVAIPSGVTKIGSCAFYNCSSLPSVSIPSSVTFLGYFGTFEGCTGLTSVTIAEGVTEISKSAFEGCSGLTSVTIPSSVTVISESAFSGCSGLTSVTIPSSVTSIGEKAFYDCDKIRTMVIGSGLEELPKGILDNPIKSLTLYGTTPYSVSGYSSTSLPGCYANCVVYVPEEAYEAYYYDGFWGYFNLQVIGDPTINVVGNKGGTVGRVSYENNVLTLSVTPDDGNVVDKIYVDNTVVYGSVNKWAPVMDVFVVVNNDGTIDIHNVTKENVVSVSFKKSVEVPTSIAEIISGEQEALEIYDLQGRKLSKPQKGINIIDGKKVIVK